MKRLALCATLLCAAVVAQSAFADVRTEARGHFKKGMASIAKGRIEEGIAELEQAYALLPHPNVLYNIGRAYAESGQFDKAIDYLRRYLLTEPSDRAEVGAMVQGLEAKRAEAQRAQALEAPPSSGSMEPPPTPEPAVQAQAAALPASAPPVDASGDVFDESVTTASRKAQNTLDAPSSVSIVTEQDIRLSGITKIPELLRRLAGVDIMQVTGGQTEVNLRGQNQRLSNKTLVLVDGRSVYADILGATFWQSLSIGVEDLERIEVVRGPGSSLYGADAFSGVINLITKKPGDGQSGASAGYGTSGVTHGSAWASGKHQGSAWRLSAGYDYLPRWSRDVPRDRADLSLGASDQNESARTVRIDARSTHKFGGSTQLTLGGGYSEGSLEILGVGALTDIALPWFRATDASAFFQSEHIDARVFWNRFLAESVLNANYLGQSLLPSRADQNILDGEVVLKRTVNLPGNLVNALRLGAAYRYKDVDWSYLDRDRVEHHYSAFVHDELRIAKPLSLVADYRLDWVPYLRRFQQNPRGSVVVHPTERSSVRASFATAFRKPTFLESYLRLPVQLPVAGAANLSEGGRRQDPNFVVNAERILTAEVGYVTKDLEWATMDASVYYNRVSNLIELSPARPITLSQLPSLGAQDAESGLFPVAFGGWANQCQAYDVVGAELGMRTFPVEGLDVYASYTLNVANQDNSACSERVRQSLVSDQRTSQHKANLGLQVRSKLGLEGSADVHVVSQQAWAEQIISWESQQVRAERFELDPYALLNLRLAYRFSKAGTELGAVGYNVLGAEHRQHPFGQLIGRQLMLQFSTRFGS